MRKAALLCAAATLAWAPLAAMAAPTPDPTGTPTAGNSSAMSDPGNNPSASGNSAMTPNAMASANGMTPITGQLNKRDQDFVTKAAQGGLAEVAAAQIAVNKSSRDDVKQFAQRMIDDHTKGNDQLTQLVGQSAQVPTEPDSSQQRQIDTLNKTSGAQFDHVYLRQQIKDHKAVIDAFQHESQRGQNPELKQFASMQLPTLQDHLQQAQSLAGQGMPSASAR